MPGTIWSVSNTTELANALLKAIGGDEIRLAPGSYGDLAVKLKNYTTPLKITSADPTNLAIVSKIYTYQSSGVVFDGLDVRLAPSATASTASYAVQFDQSSKITLLNSKLTGGPSINGVDPTATALDASGNVLGLPFGRGITVNKSTDILISSSEISQFGKGVVMVQSSAVTIDNNEIHDLRTSPIVGAALNDITITRNHTYNYTPWAWGQTYGDHGDLIHIWTDLKYQSAASTKIVIKDNFLTQGTGTPLLGIFLESNTVGFGFEGVLIDNNVISNTNHQAIRLETTSGVVSNNTAVLPDHTAVNDLPGLVAAYGSNLTVTNNLMGRFTIYADSTAVQTGNQIVTRFDSAATGYYGKVFANGLTNNPKLADLAVVSTGWGGARLAEAGVLRWEATSTGSTDTTAGTAPTGGTTDSGTGTTTDTGSGGTTDTAPAPDAGTLPLQPPSIDLIGTIANDTLNDGYIARWMAGLSGNDNYYVHHAGTTVVEEISAGVDTVFASINFTLGTNVENLNLTDAAVYGTGNALSNIINSDAGDQILSGLDGSDRLSAGAGSDTIYGGAGNDIITGGAGNDLLYGGIGKDTFVFNQASVAAHDTDQVFDFVSRQDRIDLRGIDAIASTAKDEPFKLIWSNPFSMKAGELQVEPYGSGMMVGGDVDGDGYEDFSIMLANVTKLVATDFML